MFRFRVRRYLLLGALAVLPPLLLGVAPALQGLIERVEVLETESDLDALVVDSSGNVLGPVVQVIPLSSQSAGSNVVARVVTSAESSTFWIDVTTSSIRGTETFLVFTSSDCSGPGFLFGNQSDPESLFPPVFVASEPDSLVWVAEHPATIVSISQGSFSRSDTPGCFVSSNQQPKMISATPVLDWKESFTPPFRVVTRGGF